MPHPTPNIRKFKDAKAIIFDWSGVISDDRKPVYEANVRIMKDHHLEPLPYEEWIPTTKASAHEDFLARGVHKPAEYLANAYRHALTAVKSSGIHPVLYADAPATLSRLFQNGKALFVVSKHPTEHLEHEAEAYDLKQYFLQCYGSVEDKNLIIRDIIREYGIDQRQALMIGDTIYDIMAAQKAGVVSIGITTGYHRRAQLAHMHPDAIIDSLTELLSYV